MVAGNGVLVVQGEAALIETGLRRVGAALSQGAASSKDRGGSPSLGDLLSALASLRIRLRGVADLKSVPSSVFLAPFLQVIRSEKTSGPVTCLALSAVNKFLCYGLIDPTDNSAAVTVESIADAVTHARFVGTDHSSDGIVLMKILQVLRTLVLSPEGSMLTNESVCEIMLSCFRICFETRLSELLRKNAEQCLRDMTQLIFMRLPQFSGSGLNDGESVTSDVSALSLRKSRSEEKSISTNRLNVPVGADPVPSPMVQTTGTHLSTTPMVASANSELKVLDMQGNISRSPLATVVSSDQIYSTPEQQKIANPIVDSNVSIPTVEFEKSPSKKHGRHSSMDLALNDNNYITKLVEQCVSPAEIDAPAIEDGAVSESQNSEEISPKDNIIEPEPAQQIEDKNFECEVKNDEEFTNPRGIRFVQQEEQISLLPYGLPCVRELFKFLISLCNPLDTQNNSAMVHLGLCLVETALEVAADHIGKFPSLLILVKDSLCRNLLSLMNSERVSIFALDVQVSFLLFESLRAHLKFQMETYFNKLISIIMSDTKNSYELKEITHLALESIGQMWRIPNFCSELYLNYDCDVYCTNLFEDITKLLSKTIVTAGNNHYHNLALDALVSVIETIESNCSLSKMVKSVEEDTEREPNKVCESVAIDMYDSTEMLNDAVVHNISQYLTSHLNNRHKPSTEIPAVEDLNEIKNNKKWIATGTEYFNQKPEKGIEYLQEHGILSTPLDPLQIAHFLRNNPGLDKKMIGEYISKKKNVESQILATFAKSFDMAGLRVDQALRHYLETFRLPGEAPLIFLVMEHFSEHWHDSNGNPFADTDAAFSLAYAIIMLNMDQHNLNAKKLNVPMNVDDFVKNLRGCNGGGDFDQKMLEEVYNSIKNEEIVMPAERTGIVKENYLWKVLLKRGTTEEGRYHHVPCAIYDKELFIIVWGPIVTALSSVFEKSYDVELYTLALEGFDKCASIVGQYSLSNELDMIVLSLCKFTGLLNLPENSQHINIGVALGQSQKSLLALKKVFGVCHKYADSIREGWKHILDIVLALFKGRLLPKSLIEVDDFCSPSGRLSLHSELSSQAKSQDAGIFSSLYSYIALGSENYGLRQPTQEESEVINHAMENVQQCNVDTVILTDSKFLQLESLQEFVKYLTLAGKVQEGQKLIDTTFRDDPTIFFLELLIKVVIQNRDRVSQIWPVTEAHITELIQISSTALQNAIIESQQLSSLDKQPTGLSSALLEKSTLGLLKLAICLMRSEDCASNVLKSLKTLLNLSYVVYNSIAGKIAIGLFELVKTSAQNIHSADDWAIVFTLLETTGAGAMHLKDDENYLAGCKSDGTLSSEDDSISTDRGYTSENELSNSPQTQGWILIGKDADGSQLKNLQMHPNSVNAVDPLVHSCALRRHDPRAMLKCWECLAFIVRDVAHITPYNFETCINCIRTFVEAGLDGTNEEKITNGARLPLKRNVKRKNQTRRNRRQGNEDNDEDETPPDGYQLISIQLLDLMHTLHSRTAQIFKWWREESALTPSLEGAGLEWCDLWHLAWQPLLQGIARLCTDKRKQVSNSAVTYLQRALLVHDLQTLSGEEWEACFHRILFPLLARLTNHHDEVRLRANTIMCKVFLHHLTPLLTRPSFSNLWLSLLDLMRMMMTGPQTTDILYEATLESLKNMLLVMDSVKVFHNGDSYSELWNLTWTRINAFIPNLKDELFKPIEHNQIVVADKEVVEEQNIPNVLTPVSVNQNSPIPVSMPPKLAPVGSVTAPTVPQFKGSSIILQPPIMSSQVQPPLFTHLGQMVSTPIGMASVVPPPTNLPLSYASIQPVTSPDSAANFKSPQLVSNSLQYNMTSFKLVSPQHTANPAVKTNESAKKTDYIGGATLNVEEQQPGSLYGEYLTDPYNPMPALNLPNITCEMNVVNTPPPLLQKSQSVTSSPARSALHSSNIQFGSSDNLKSSDSSGAFSFSKYFLDNPQTMPPGSEILYDETFLTINEG